MNFRTREPVSAVPGSSGLVRVYAKRLLTRSAAEKPRGPAVSVVSPLDGKRPKAGPEGEGGALGLNRVKAVVVYVSCNSDCPKC
jgi:hypothetical protein